MQKSQQSLILLHGSFVDMPTILSVETATQACSVAISQEGEPIASIDLLIERAHSEKLTLLIQECISQTGLQLADVDAFAVSMGPGSYTGLRIGVATIKGLCFALEKPLIAINTLEAMAYEMKGILPTNYGLCPVLDARRMEVYCAMYDTSLQSILPTDAVIIDEHSFKEQLTEMPLLFWGNGAKKCQEKLSHHPNAHFIERIIHPSARSMANLAEMAFLQKRFEDIAYFEPFYLKEFVSKTKSVA